MATTDDPETLRGEVERLRTENQRLRAEVEHLRAEMRKAGRYLAEPPRPVVADAGPAEIEWEYQRGDLYDDLGDD